MRTARVVLPGTAQIIEADVGNDGLLRVGAHTLSAAEVRFAPASEGLVYGVALNGRADLEALGRALTQAPYANPPRAPVLYVKPWNTHSHHGAVIALPRDAQEVEVLAAVGVVIDRQATRVSEGSALEHVRGYTIAADLSLPQTSFYRPPIREKCFDASCPLGPWLVGREHVPDPAALELHVWFGTQCVQQRGLRDLVRPIPRLIADVTQFMTLYPGDILLAGIPHEGPHARPGQPVSVRVDGIGSLEFRIAERSA
jgi:5-oxopent-3-ene-1,2,5-tricarboxylate decarboxylase/2-hydroxyhepta-2,4-diene-1,7-dioate isomerase